MNPLVLAQRDASQRHFEVRLRITVQKLWLLFPPCKHLFHRSQLATHPQVLSIMTLDNPNPRVFQPEAHQRRTGYGFRRIFVGRLNNGQGGGASIQRQWRDVQTSGSGWVGRTPSSQCSGTSLRPKKLPQKWDVESRTPAHTVGGLVWIPFPLSLQNTFECNCQPVCQSRTCYSCFQPCVLGIMYLRLSLVERWIFLYLAESGQRKCFWFLIWFWFGLSQKKHISLRTAKV